MEAVIRRAVELQARTGDGADDGIAEAEVLRIGGELGLDPGHLQRALAEVRGRVPHERGVVSAVMGPALVRAARTVRRPAASVGMLLEDYLVRSEYMVVQRRFPDRTRYLRGSGAAAMFGRATRKFGGYPALDLHQLDVAVAAVDDSSAFVELSVEMKAMRTGLAAGGMLGGGGAAAGIAAAVLATPIIDPLALVGLPVFGGMMWGMRAIFGAASRSTSDKLESLLDRLEHGELGPAKAPESGGFGFGGVKVQIRGK